MRRPFSRLLVIAFAASVVATNGCGHYRPALFADRPVVTVVHDDQPIRVPSRRTYNETEQLSDIYLQRPLFDVVRPLEFPTAGDVNAMDEVPTSTWFDPKQATLAVSPRPKLPLIAVDEPPATNDDALAVRDAEGVRYELLADPPDTPGLLTGAEVLGGHLLRGLGLHAPPASILTVPDSAIVGDGAPASERLAGWLARRVARVNGTRRVSATRWPEGIDVGVTGDYSARKDDRNDAVDHHDRRTLRATKLFAHWLGWTRFGVRSTRDVYVGVPGEGHLVHYLVGTSRALGTQDLQPDEARDEESGGVGWNLVTLGLSRPPVIAARRSPFPSVGYLPATLVAGVFNVSPPYSPFVRLTPADEYWAGKRLMDAGDDPLQAGLAASGLPEEATRLLAEVLASRRRLLVAHAVSVVTPVDVVVSTGRSIWLRDRAIAAGVAEARDTLYDVAFLDAEGGARAPSVRGRAAGELTLVTLPRTVSFGLVVLRVRAIRAGVEAPRACDVHVMADRASARIIGVRH